MLVAELFSPPRFSKMAQDHGKMGLAFDKKQGWDLLDSNTQSYVDKLLDQTRPELLIVCPPCTHEGGWENLNQYFRTPMERAVLIRNNRRRLRFAVEQIHKQIRRGGDFMFEHPWPSHVWRSPIMGSLCRKYGIFRVDMCAYNLRCPDTGLPIQKATGLMCSRSEVAQHMKQCPGCAQHRKVEGQLKSGQRVSDMVASYTPEFVSAVYHAFAQAGLRACDFECQASLVEMYHDCFASAPAEEPSEQVDVPNDIKQSVLKLHKNLGHPSTTELLRILKHSGASQQAIEAAKSLECSVCANNARPASALPANPPKVMAFNEQIGLDVKYIQGWKPNQTIPCVSMVDYGSSLQVCVPMFSRETAEQIKTALRDQWIAWAGAPSALITDPARTNLSEALGTFCESLGIRMLHTAAEAHYQLGKVERHGQWFEHIFNRVWDEVRPSDMDTWLDCLVQTQVAKNSLIATAGVSPYQIVFGRNPKLPADLLQDSPDVAAIESASDVATQTRIAARKAVIEAQDNQALKAAIRARPRPHRDFQSGDWVYYWRTQKWQNGVLIRGGKWYGAAMVLGYLGRNLIVAHRKSIYRCAPEQLRLATSDEKTVAEFSDNELLGIRNLLEKGQFPKSQFTDLTQESMPPQPEVIEDGLRSSNPGALTAAENLAHQQSEQPTTPVVPSAVSPEAPESTPGQPSSSYGPLRLRITGKGPDRFVEPFQTIESHPEDLSEMLTNLQSSLNEDVPAESSSPRASGHKRMASVTNDSAVEPPKHRSKTEEDDVLLASTGQTADVYMAAFLQKRHQKELPVTGNPEELQSQIDLAKTAEWETLVGKGAVQVWKGEAAKRIRTEHADRFIGTRYVVTRKEDEDGPRVKARLCVQGHLDPDFKEKINSGCCHSPTMSQLARALVLQTIVSKHWVLSLGDIKGAFLEAGPLSSKYRPLYANQPRGGVPSLDPDDVIEVTGNIYGSNDAPFNWWSTFDEVARGSGWERSQFDNCLYFLRTPGKPSELCGILGAHVDDTITGGSGSFYDEAISKLKSRFPYRKWRVGSGEFCGIQFSQDPKTFEISYHQREYAEHLRPINLSKERQRDKESPATDKEIAALRAVNGGANWLASQSRPDLCVQTSFSQQSFPSPKVKDILYANQLVHRARQYSHVTMTVRDIPWDQLGICFHSDAGFANAKAHATQAGYILAFVDDKLKNNEPAKWSPFSWKSYRLPRVVCSTLGAESQSFSTASALAEWMSLMVSEAKHGSFDLRDYVGVSNPSGTSKIHKPKVEAILTGVTDCKSLYDSLTSMSSAVKCDDKRVAIDLAILRQCISRTGLEVRWCPTQLMIADGLTKDASDPADLLRAILDVGEYQLNNEATILAIKRKHREHRAERRSLQTQQEKERKTQKQKHLSACQQFHRT